ncbi:MULTISPECIES: sulfatase-like hydrolase/transferase [unclassified Exiguobacterium]|uniref:sulfatase-like hydrolase/transferase n=1 Tax=unclassified Exiguobacterium TaxID=2644629 RepID=UPI001BE8B029|nr:MULTISPECIES: sulfatase-like hydrolase/transferase [unclassified Exiguobacterium]
MYAYEKGLWKRDDVYENIGFKHFFSQKDYSKWNQSLVIFYGDHDSGLVNEGSEMRKKADVSSPVAAFELERRIPLFIKKPDQQTGRVMKENGGQIDIAPTIIDLLNVKTSYMMRQSLIDDQPNLPSFRDGSFRYEDFYYEADLTKASGEGTCYDVLTEKKVEMKFCRNQVKDVSEQLKLSDKIIKKNELK